MLEWHSIKEKPKENIPVLLWNGIVLPGIWNGKEWILNRFIASERDLFTRIGSYPIYWAYYNEPKIFEKEK